MNLIFRDLLCENGQISLTRSLVIASFVLFFMGTAFLMLTGMSWQHYDTFASMTGGGGLAAQLANKLMNSKYNSAPEQFPDKGGTK